MTEIHTRVDQAARRPTTADLDSELWGIARLMAEELEALIGRLDQLADRVAERIERTE